MQVMSKMQNYYQVMPENFNDDLADSLMKAFPNLESVDVIDEIPALKNELWQRGYLIAPRPDKVVESKDLWFVKVNFLLKGSHEIHDEIEKFDCTVIETPKELVKLLLEITNSVRLDFNHNDSLAESKHVQIWIGKAVHIDCYRIK